MNDALRANFAIAAKLSPGAATKIQAVLRCLQENTVTTIVLRDPVEGGNSVGFDLVAGAVLDLDDCCGLRDVSRTDDRLEA